MVIFTVVLKALFTLMTTSFPNKRMSFVPFMIGSLMRVDNN